MAIRSHAMALRAPPPAPPGPCVYRVRPAFRHEAAVAVAVAAVARSAEPLAQQRIRARRYTSVDWIANLRGLGTSNLLRRILGPVVCTTSVAVAVYLISALLTPQAGP